MRRRRTVRPGTYLFWAYDEESYDCHPAWMGRCLKIRSIYRILNFKS
ncbi:MAG: hypothetical protein KH010_20685 [Hungatella hathewayi]|nr:hypothetical protein [Hungatella sp. L36]MBC5708282.1 hypothetical protein [Hungatella hominis]MBS5074689.1 hypothetical protein [Hungatella hathewayi]MBS5241157.1 hypothetical protein [Hungatella hathewayi]